MSITASANTHTVKQRPPSRATVRKWPEFSLHTRKNPVRTPRLKLNPLLASDYSSSCRRDITSHPAHCHLLWTSDWIKNTEYVWVAPRRPHSEWLRSSFHTTLIPFTRLWPEFLSRYKSTCPDTPVSRLLPRMVKGIPHRGSRSRSPSAEQHP